MSSFFDAPLRPYTNTLLRNIDPRTGLPKRQGSSGGGSGGGQQQGFQPYTVPGFTPDYKSLLAGDPYLSQLRADLGAFSAGDRSQRDALLQRAAVGFGQVPDFTNAAGLFGLGAGDLQGIFTPEIQSAARQNTEAGLSTSARIGRAFERQVQQIQDALAARGGLRSGAFGVALQDAQLGRRQAESDAMQQLLDVLGQVQQAYAQGERDRQLQLARAGQDAAGRVAAANPATPDRRVVFRDGRWVYEDTGEPAPPPPSPAASAPTNDSLNLGAGDDEYGLARLRRLLGAAQRADVAF